MYAYPAGFPMGLLEVIRTHPRVCTYLDMPIQHSSDHVLKSMRRGISARKTRELVDEIRSRVPGIALRTTLIVGYPTETERAFDDLVRFVQEVRFSRLGVFTYSREDGTGAYALGDPVPVDEKERRRSVIMEIQKEISEEENEKLVGTRQRVMVDSITSGECIGRTERDAPEVDGEICFTSVSDVRPGDLVDVDIVDASEYDLFGIHSRTIEADSAAGTNGEVLI
jgi:ribosomal protein S12 methylthiotransferase